MPRMSTQTMPMPICGWHWGPNHCNSMPVTMCTRSGLATQEPVLILIYLSSSWLELPSSNQVGDEQLLSRSVCVSEKLSRYLGAGAPANEMIRMCSRTRWGFSKAWRVPTVCVPHHRRCERFGVWLGRMRDAKYANGALHEQGNGIQMIEGRWRWVVCQVEARTQCRSRWALRSAVARSRHQRPGCTRGRNRWRSNLPSNSRCCRPRSEATRAAPHTWPSAVIR